MRNVKSSRRAKFLRIIAELLMDFIYDTAYIITCTREFLTDPETLPNKIAAAGLIALSIPLIILEGDATVMVVLGMFAVPMFFAKTRWIF